MTFLWPALLLLLLVLPMLVARPDLGAPATADRRAVLEPVARPRRGAAVVAVPAPPAVRAVRPRARQPGLRDGPARGDHRRCRPAGRPSFSRWTCRGACARPTSRPTGSWPPRRPRRASSRARTAGPRSAIVAFAGFAEIIQVPTNDEEVLLDVIAALATGRRTAIGSAILESIDAIAEIDPIVARSIDELTTSRPRRRPPCPKGAYAPGDHRAADRWREQRRSGAARGRAAGGRSRAARLHDRLRDGEPGRPAAALRRPVHRQRARRQRRSGARLRWRRVRRRRGRRQGGGFRRAIDEETLTAVADATGGEYYPAESAQQLKEVFAQLPTSLILAHEVVEISVAFTAIAVLLVVAGDPARAGVAAAVRGGPRPLDGPDA